MSATIDIQEFKGLNQQDADQLAKNGFLYSSQFIEDLYPIEESKLDRHTSLYRQQCLNLRDELGIQTGIRWQMDFKCGEPIDCGEREVLIHKFRRNVSIWKIVMEAFYYPSPVESK